MSLRSMICVGLVTASLLAPLPADAASQSDNMKLLQNYDDVTYGNEIDFDGDLVYVGEYGQPDAVVNVLRVRGKKVTRVAAIPCRNHNDVEVLGKGLISVSFQGHGRSCTERGVGIAGTGVQGGIQIIDASNPRRPRYHGNIALRGGTHTHTPYPGQPFVYAAAGGADAYIPFGGLTHIVDVSDPDKLEIAATYHSDLNPAGCHDIAFERIDRKMIGFCPGLGGTEIWDSSDPTAPSAIARMVLPFGMLPHTVAVSPDDKIVAISEEAYTGHLCGADGPPGAIWFYDITDLANPVLLGYYGPPRGDYPVGALSGAEESCTAHNFNFIPGTRLLVAAWIGGGTNVIDVSDPANAKEIAHYTPDDTAAMSSYWYRDLIFVGDFSRGLDVLEFDRP